MAGIGEGGVVVGGRRTGVGLEDAAGAPLRILSKLNASEEESIRDFYLVRKKYGKMIHEHLKH